MQAARQVEITADSHDSNFVNQRHYSEASLRALQSKAVITDAKHRHYKRGFTLIEALVVLGIVSAIALLIFINVRTSRDERQLDAATRQLASDLRRVQNMAISGQILANQTPFGYGILTGSSSQADRYYIYYNPSEGLLAITDPADGTLGLISETVFLNYGVIFAPDSNSYNRSIYFFPPDPKTYIDGSNAKGLSLSLTLRLGDLTRQVIVDTAGKIEVQ